MKNLTLQEDQDLDMVLADFEYICGAPLFPPEHPHSDCLISERASCTSDVSPYYYSCNLGLPNCCYACGGTSNLHDEPDLSGKYRVHKVCAACHVAGRAARTRGPVKGGEPAAKRKALK